MKQVQYLRCVEIDRLLSHQTYPNCQSLQHSLNVSERTVLRDIDALKEVYAAPIYYSKKYNGYYYKRPFVLQDTKLTEGDLLALTIGRLVLQQFRGAPFYGTLENAFHRLSQHLPEYIQLKDTASFNGSLELLNNVQLSRKFPRIVNGLMSAFKDQRQIKVELFVPRSKQKVQSIQLHPQRLVFQHGQWMLYASENEEACQLIPLSRIQKIRKLKHTATRIPEEKLSVAPVSDSADHPIKLKVRFAPGLKPILEDRLADLAQSMETDFRGQLIVDFAVTDLEAVYQWLLSFGPQVEILEPLTLRKRVRKDLIAQLNLY